MTVPHPDRIGILAPMPSELRPVVKTFSLTRSTVAGDGLHAGRVGDVEIIAGRTGIGTAAATRATERLLDTTSVDRVLVVGIAGGVHPDSSIADIVVPEVVVDEATGAEYVPAPLGSRSPSGTLMTGDGLVVDRDDFARLADRGVVALDMETAAVAAVCERRGCAWSVVRSLSDLPGDVDPDVLALAGPDGTPDAKAALRFVVTQPGRLPKMVRLARNSQRAANAAARAAVELCARPPSEFPFPTSG